MNAPPPVVGVYPPPAATSGKSAFSPAVVAIIAVLGSAFLVVSYYRIFAKLCTRWQNRRDVFDIEGQLNGAELDANASPLPNHGLDEALIKKIPIFVYKSGDGFTLDTDCPVCLMEFVDHQELRMLPKCAHAFHVSCIDMWLTSHSTCPLCRASIWPEQVMNQYPPQSPPMNMHGVLLSPGNERMDFAAGFNGERQRSPAPTLRGLLNYEDQHAIWVSDTAVRGDPGEESLRLYDPRDHGGDSSSRHYSLPGADGSSVTPPSSVGGTTEDSTYSTCFSSETGRQVTRTASFKEPHSRSRDREHKWHIPARRPSFRKNPFSIARSYSMGTSRRLVHALEFLDLEELRNGQNKGGGKIFSPQEYGISTTPEYPATNLSSSPTELLPRDTEKSEIGQEFGAGPSTRTQGREAFLLSSKLSDSSSDPDLPGAMLKNSGPGRGRSISFRSPFTLKRSLSGSRNMFSFRHSTKG